ncbi:uncharacterized protein si:ch1073-145m9.1 isoform X1 [Hypomesus transpacificus]|uniref:uncharacterized protein si:ch1073-145m9.1 isoform X1 n=1 Tax=Hypomesus transpacificus TaxID=137520 RepID=UPI001F07E18D|nr:uncharacterized protein si:ch1073-145m9.1 isoform X1 [Hypomesus transpacificus]
MGLQVLLYWPNIIGYVRVALIFAAATVPDQPSVFLVLYSTSVILDGFDGWVARRLGQISSFGAWLDVVVDNLGRGMLWTMVFKCGWLVSTVEWCVLVCNHNSRGAHWKSSFTDSPSWIQAIMANGFWTPLGMWVIGGVHGLPLWLYGLQWGVLSYSLCFPPWLQAFGTVFLTLGRLLGLSVEVLHCCMLGLERCLSEKKHSHIILLVVFGLMATL